jgi:MOSC domain-containing protein YiiM
MKVISVNISGGGPLDMGNKTIRTGIDKRAVSSARVGTLGLESDVVANKKHHGGLDQAVYVYGSTDYDYWVLQLGESIAPGTFGENLTISDFESADVFVGDRLRISGVLLEFTAPRIPCATLAARMNDKSFVKKFTQAERPGVYCRVLEPGVVRAGDVVTLEPAGVRTFTIRQLMRWYYDLEPLEPKEILETPIAARWRKSIEEDLAKQN